MSEATEDFDNEREKIRILSEVLHDDIIAIKKDSKVTRVKPDTVYLADAAELCNIGVVGNQVHQILIKQKIIDSINNMDDLLAKYMPYLVIIAMCVATVLVAVLVVDYVK